MVQLHRVMQSHLAESQVSWHDNRVVRCLLPYYGSVKPLHEFKDTQAISPCYIEVLCLLTRQVLTHAAPYEKTSCQN
jgi:hypothetical protein